MAYDDKGWLDGSDPVPPDLVTKAAPFVVPREQERFTEYLGVIRKADPQVNIIGEGKKRNFLK